jgi:hypothetical protein
MEERLVTGRGRQVERDEKARHVRVAVATPVRVAVQRGQSVTLPRRGAVVAQRFLHGVSVFFGTKVKPDASLLAMRTYQRDNMIFVLILSFQFSKKNAKKVCVLIKYVFTITRIFRFKFSQREIKRQL